MQYVVPETRLLMPGSSVGEELSNYALLSPHAPTIPDEHFMDTPDQPVSECVVHDPLIGKFAIRKIESL